LKNYICIGIGGSYLGPEFVYEALRFEKKAQANSEGKTLRFLANIDPIDLSRALEGLDLEETLFIVISKTFTTAETMLNARTVKQLIIDHYRAKECEEVPVDDQLFIEHHVCAISTNLKATNEFGIQEANVFGFWDWVGGRYSVSSAVGLLPLALFYGYDIVQEFLTGLHSVDKGLYNDMTTVVNYCKNAPTMLGLIGFYNTYICGHSSRAILPYC
jgi:glucose-6-phosphate isomerase